MSSLTTITPDFLRQMKLPHPGEGDKKARGNVLVIAGGTEVPGGALLAGTGALRAGAGRLQLATCARNATALALAIPEALVLGLPETSTGAIDPIAASQLKPYVENADAVLLGPGLPDEAAIAALATAILGSAASKAAFLFDAGAIRHLGSRRGLLARRHGRIVITPHAGEMAGLMSMDQSDVEAKPASIASQAASELSAVVALKGAITFVATPDGKTSVCREGNVGLATSGSGDVLAGIIAGLLARGAPAFAATCWGVYLHAVAGDHLSKTIGPLGFLARELLAEIPGIMGRLS
jgi:ADP-dependent NAD(P)H-hydrate dehydratase